MPKVTVDELAEAIGKELGDYFDDITEDVKNAVEVTTRECVAEIKQRSPKRTGNYSRSWTATEVFNRRGSIRFTVHNKKHYRLTHLLEYGHAKRGGGRLGDDDDVKPREHIAPAEQNAEKNLIKRIEEAIKNDT